jgi:putative transposase
MKSLQKFASVQGAAHSHFNQQRHLFSLENCKERRSAALTEWRAVMSEGQVGFPAPDKSPLG